MKTTFYLFLLLVNTFVYAQYSETRYYKAGQTKADAKSIAKVYESDMNERKFMNKTLTKNSEDDYVFVWNRNMNGSQSETHVRYQFYDNRVTATISNPYFISKDGKRYRLSENSPLDSQKDLFKSLLNVYHKAFFNYIGIDDNLSAPIAETKYQKQPVFQLSTIYKSGAKTNCDSGDCQNGFGVKSLGNNEYYVGYSKNGEMNGAGIILEKNFKYLISGFYKNNLPNGMIYEIAQGTMFLGYFSQGLPNGDGYAINSGTITGGNFINGSVSYIHPYKKLSTTPYFCHFGTCKDDLSKYKFSDDSYYVGFYKNGEKTLGVIDYVNGDSYAGTFNNKQLNGPAFYSSKGKGEIFIGHFINGQRDGESVVLNLTTLKGKGVTYDKGKVISSTPEFNF